MPKIAIDVSPLNNGDAIRGVGVYTKNLVESLQYEVSTNPDFKNFNIQLVTDNSQLSTDFDLIHYPYFHPFQLTLPNKSNIPQIITIHDMIERQFKSQYPVGIKGEIKWLIQQKRARQSDYIIAVSHYSKHQISDILRYPSDHIYVTYEAADNTYHNHHTKQELAKIKTKYNLPDKFVLYLGDVNWNKNIPELVKACVNLDYPLVIVGKQALDIDKLTLQKPSITRIRDLYRHIFNLPSPQLKHISLLKKLFHNPQIHRLGYVSDEDLPIIFQLATIYCQPSFAEGFGLGVVKAMQSGLPVVYSQETCLPEIMDYNGIFFDPYQPGTLKKSLQQMWADKLLRQEYSKKGLIRAKFFTWQKTAIQTLALYKLALINEK